MVSAQPLEFERSIAELERQIERLRQLAAGRGLDLSAEIRDLEKKLEGLREETYRELTPIERVQVARHPQRPYTLDYIARAFQDFIELHGDRGFRDDPAVVGGWARLDGRTVMVLGQQKGRNIKENLLRNFGMAHPEGYRKALRLMRLAEKFRRPVITLIDTPGAYPGIGAEERGIAEAIARNLLVMAILETPIVSVIIGEGGSGGALGIALADRVLMFENAMYSVISPEGCASILFRETTPEATARAAASLKLTAPDLHELGVVDEILAEPPGGAHRDWDAATQTLREAAAHHLDELSHMPIDELLETRYAKYRRMGSWTEVEA
ncbi:MAG: acetyl-CoA carboxylase carboxyltransferase subunit alpha [Gemmatimonadetes bacterium]|nr:acetyl-CoA carboxylase carboxyltransferase subunit alpha [Gemmatimonadota bacterium]